MTSSDSIFWWSPPGAKLGNHSNPCTSFIVIVAACEIASIRLHYITAVAMLSSSAYSGPVEMDLKRQPQIFENHTLHGGCCSISPRSGNTSSRPRVVMATPTTPCTRPERSVLAAPSGVSDGALIQHLDTYETKGIKGTPVKGRRRVLLVVFYPRIWNQFFNIPL